MAGLRLGFIFAEAGTIGRFLEALPPWSVNTPASRAGAAALTDGAYIEETRAWLKSERAKLLEGLGSIKGLKTYDPGANFIMVRIQEGDMDSIELKRRLLEKRLLIRTLDGFAGLGEDYFRVAIRSSAENVRLLEALALEFKGMRAKKKIKKPLHEHSPL
jgi:threonine-phosphate decarboxylase